ncbi:MAG: energy-coupling factor transporter transmembrane protein EcfT [Gracilibacteraceae bacterium]|jgi:energy-coupling factor transport system permease protein|nr:energy-coupling factor transporter transmembrane protein EcfT [Gracilibacteraceae bacterium]
MSRRGREAFSSYHPLVNMLYFILVFTCGMFFLHPVCLLLSLSGGLAYSVYMDGKKSLRFALVYMLPLLVLTALLNPAFNHEGVTILLYLRDGNPLTLESILYGIAAAVMLIAIIFWFNCYSAIMTSDKFVYLFGRIIPALSLILSMALRFVPRFRVQISVIADAQRGLGRDPAHGNLWRRARQGMRLLSILVTWALENAVETADSMKSRGYGLPGRTAFSLYRLERRDGWALLFIVFCAAYILRGAAAGALRFVFFPALSGVNGDLYSLTLFALYALLCFMPFLLNLREERRWKSFASKT